MCPYRTTIRSCDFAWWLKYAQSAKSQKKPPPPARTAHALVVYNADYMSASNSCFKQAQSANLLVHPRGAPSYTSWNVLSNFNSEQREPFAPCFINTSHYGEQRSWDHVSTSRIGILNTYIFYAYMRHAQLAISRVTQRSLNRFPFWTSRLEWHSEVIEPVPVLNATYRVHSRLECRKADDKRTAMCRYAGTPLQSRDATVLFVQQPP